MSFEKPVEQNKGVQIEYKYKGKYGNILSSGVNDNFDFPIPEGAVEFDGYIRTKYDSFAFQGPIEDAKGLFDKIKKLEHLTIVLQRIEDLLLTARSERNQGDVEEQKRIKEDVLKEMDALEEVTNTYKV